MAVATPHIEIYRLSAADFHRMVEIGVLDEETRVELIEGELVVMSPIGSRHSGVVNQLATIFFERLQRRAIVSVQNAVHLSDQSEPQPDLALLAPRADYYKRSQPTPEEILLVVEVADSSLEYDREVKLPLYSRAGIPEVWIVNLVDNWVEVYREPAAVGYTSLQKVLPGRTAAPLAFGDLVVAVEEIFVS